MKPDGSRPQAQYLFFALIVAYVLYAAVRLVQMPEVMATHFGFDGRANGWMSGSTFLVFTLAMSALAVGLRWFLVFAARMQKGINIPGYQELSAEEKTEFATVMEQQSWVFGCLFISFLFAVNVIIFSTNSSGSERLSAIPALVITVVFVGAMLWWSLTLVSSIQRLRKKGL
jgi:uncharacterized membrane protein